MAEITAVTTDSIKKLADQYYSYVPDPTGPKLMKLARGIHEGLQEVGGSWELDDSNPRKSLFEGLTKLCWHFSTNHGSDAATAYDYFTTKVYNLWKNMTKRPEADKFKSECHTSTDSLSDWTAITRVKAPRETICNTALTVTTSMYDYHTQEVRSSTILWNGRL